MSCVAIFLPCFLGTSGGAMLSVAMTWGTTLTMRSMVTPYQIQSHTLHGAGIFTNIYPKNHPNVGKYSIHGASGNEINEPVSDQWAALAPRTVPTVPNHCLPTSIRNNKLDDTENLQMDIQMSSLSELISEHGGSQNEFISMGKILEIWHYTKFFNGRSPWGGRHGHRNEM